MNDKYKPRFSESAQGTKAIDSYLLPLEDPDDIQHARDLIANGAAAGTPIVVAAIAAGPNVATSLAK